MFINYFFIKGNINNCRVPQCDTVPLIITTTSTTTTTTTITTRSSDDDNKDERLFKNLMLYVVLPFMVVFGFIWFGLAFFLFKKLPIYQRREYIELEQL